MLDDAVADEPAVLLSVQPQFAHALIAGVKTAEIRRRFPPRIRQRLAYIYSSNPDRLLLGTLEIRRVVEVRPDTAWSLYGARLEIGRAQLDKYLRGTKTSFVLEVENPLEFDTPVPLASLRADAGVAPPQSYRYLDAEAQSRISALTR